jgi:hypothetical protein
LSNVLISFGIVVCPLLVTTDCNIVYPPSIFVGKDITEKRKGKRLTQRRGDAKAQGAF